MIFTIDNIQVRYKEMEDEIIASIESIDLIYETPNTKDIKTIDNLHSISRINMPTCKHNQMSNRIDVFVWKQLREAMLNNIDFPKTSMNFGEEEHTIEYISATCTEIHTVTKSTLSLTLNDDSRKAIATNIENLFKAITKLEEFVWKKNIDLTKLKKDNNYQTESQKIELPPKLRGHVIDFRCSINKLESIYEEAYDDVDLSYYSEDMLLNLQIQ